MKFCIKLCFVFFVPHFLSAQNVELQWVRQLGGVYWEKSTSIKVDQYGNVYTTGDFSGTIDFDPGIGVFYLSALNGTNSFITKFDNDGNFIWAKSFEGVEAFSLSLKIDNSGNVLTTGKYTGLVDFDPGVGIFYGSLVHNTFISKLDSNGDFIWLKTLGNMSNGSAGYIETKQIDVDNFDNIYLIGKYGTELDFDPSPSIYSLATTENSIDFFILKLNANGDFVWAKSIGSKFLDECNKMALDQNGNIYVTGTFTGNCDFDPGVGIYNINVNSWTTYILKLDNSGDFVWAKTFESISLSTSVGVSLVVDNINNVYVCGSYAGQIDFDPSTSIFYLPYNGGSDSYVVKLNSVGEFLWAKGIGNSTNDLIADISIDNSLGVYLTGAYFGTVDINPGINNFNLTSEGEEDIFILKLNVQGDFQWGKSMGGTQIDIPYSIYVDLDKSVYTTGTFENIADFDPSSNVENLNSYGFKDIFIQKLGTCITPSYETINVSECNNYTLNNQTYNNSGTYTQVIPNSSGCDSIITLNLTINRKFTEQTKSICEGSSFYAGGANQTVSGTYKDTLQTSLGCDSIITTTLIVNPKPKPDLGADRNLCSNDYTYLNPGNFTNYIWQDNSVQPTFLIGGTGQYWVTVTDNNNCKNTDTVNILAIDTIPNNFLPQDKKLCIGSVANISLSNYKSYIWSTGNTSNSIQLSKIGKYYLDVIDLNNCKGSDTIYILRNTQCIPFLIPNSFTPNGDALNKVFKPTIQQDIKGYKFVIYNRYGQKVFETTTYSIGWDGKFMGEIQPVGTYLYFIEMSNGIGYKTQEKGSVMLLR